MAMRTLWGLAFRDLGRNRRRSILSMVAVALGLALLIVSNGLVGGVVDDAVENAVRLETGHLQIRSATYDADTLGLRPDGLIDHPDELAATIRERSAIEDASPVLWAGAILNAPEESVQLKLMGIDPLSPAHDAIRDAIVSGVNLDPDDRDGILLSRRLADNLGLELGRKASLTVFDADGRAVEGPFEIRGLYATGVSTFDDTTAVMPLSKAQAFTGAGDRSSAIVITLEDAESADAVAAELAGPGLELLTWREMNQVLLQGMDAAMQFYVVLYGVVLVVVAVIVANTQLMAVYERIREVGVLAALGMKPRQVFAMLMLEAAMLAAIGVALGILLGSAGVALLARNGIYIGEMSTVAAGIALGSTMYARFAPGSILWLSGWELLIILLASLYPAYVAARLEPVEALHQH